MRIIYSYPILSFFLSFASAVFAESIPLASTAGVGVEDHWKGFKPTTIERSEIEGKTGVKRSFIVRYSENNLPVQVNETISWINNKAHLIGQYTVIVNEVNIIAKEGVSSSKVQNALSSVVIADKSPWIVAAIKDWRMYRVRIDIDTADTYLELTEMIKGLVDIEAVSPSSIPNLSTSPLERYSNMDQWAFDNPPLNYKNRYERDYNTDIDLSEVYAYLTGKELVDVVVAVFDSGVNLFHQDLKGRAWVNPGETQNGVDDDCNGLIDDINGWNFGLDNNMVSDYYTERFNDKTGHGTHVAGIIAAKQVQNSGVAGIASNARIMSLPISDSGVFEIVQGIHYAIQKGAQVINNSWGIPNNDPLLKQAYLKAHAAGILQVSAAGNDGQDFQFAGQVPCSYYFMTGKGLCVGSTNKTDNFSTFSNRSTQGGVNILAPGEDIISLSIKRDQRYEVQSGTSMSAPQVAGAAALLMGLLKDEAYTPDDIRHRLIRNADPVVKQTLNNNRLNVLQAVKNPPRPDRFYCRNTSPAGGPRTSRLPFANMGEKGINGLSEETAYTICSPTQLMQITGNHLDKYFKVMSSLNFSLLANDFLPIGYGDSMREFQGVIDGNNFTFYGYENNTSLIKAIGDRGIVKNLRIYNAKVNALNGETVGILARANGGSIDSVSVSGVIRGKSTVGGLVGLMDLGIIRNSFVNAHITGESNVGGLVGELRHKGKIILSSSKGEIYVGNTGGGIVGVNYGGDISRSTSSMFLDGYSNLGGIAGKHYCGGGIYHSYATGRVNAEYFAAGLVAELANAEIHNTYASGEVTYSNGTGGGLVAKNADTRFRSDDPLLLDRCTDSSSVNLRRSSVSNSFWNTSHSGNGNIQSAEGVGLTIYQMMNLNLNPLDGSDAGYMFWINFNGFTPALTLLPPYDFPVDYPPPMQPGGLTVEQVK